MIHPYDAASELRRIHGIAPWYYEMRTEATTSGCPRTYADPTHGPKTQQ